MAQQGKQSFAKRRELARIEDEWPEAPLEWSSDVLRKDQKQLHLTKKASRIRRPNPIESEPTFMVRQRTDGEGSVTRRVLIKCDRRVHFVKEHEIISVEAAGNYVHVSLGPDSLLTRSSLNRVASLLSTERFVRIHRSAIVNLDQICHLEPQPGGEYILTLHGGKQLKASRRHVGELLKLIRASGATESAVAQRAAAARSAAPRPRLVPRFY